MLHIIIMRTNVNEQLLKKLRSKGRGRSSPYVHRITATVIESIVMHWSGWVDRESFTRLRLLKYSM